MFHSYVPFICNLSIPMCSHRLNRAIHQHIFSSLAIAKFADCMTCLALQMFLFWFRQTIEFLPLYFCLVWICLNMFPSYISFLCNLSISVCSHRLSRATTGCNPKGFPPLSWWSREIQVPICLQTHIHVCLTQFKLHPAVSSTGVKTQLCTPTVALRLYN